MSRIIPAALVGLSLWATVSGCSLAPEYVRPSLPVPDEIGAPQETAASQNVPGWEAFFREPRLKALIETAIKENRDLKMAALNVLAARADYGITRADRLPSLEAQGQKSVTGGPERDTARSYELSVMSAFEADFFGRLRNMTEAAFERYLASEEAARAARLSLIAQVAEAYLESRMAQEGLGLARRTQANWRDSLAFIEQRLISGQSALLDLEQARAQVARAEAAVAENEVALSRADSNLKLLLGAQGDIILPPAWTLAKWPEIHLPENISSLTLLKRPDILEAEHQLIASHADIGAARAAFFPSLSLTGQFGYMSGELNTLVAGSNAAWNFLPRLTVPLFAGGRNRQNLELAEVRRSQAVVTYEKAIQTAFREVSEALLVRPRLIKQHSAQLNYINVQRRVLELAQNRYQNGVISYLDVLEAQRDVFEAEMALLNIRRSQLLNDISLYLALGGGLDTPAPVLAD
jgi:Cu(I)/Ag(I) efflux system outer membrane protein